MGPWPDERAGSGLTASAFVYFFFYRDIGYRAVLYRFLRLRFTVGKLLFGALRRGIGRRHRRRRKKSPVSYAILEIKAGDPSIS